MAPERNASSLLSLASSHGGRSSRGSTVTNYSMSEQAELDTIRQEKAALLREIRGLKDEIANCDYIIERLDVDEDGRPNAERQVLAIGRKKFNLDSKKGIEFLVEQKAIEHTPEDVAKFLFHNDGLLKTAIGDYLGELGFNQQVLEEFVRLHSFSTTDLVTALRTFLWSFRLPGEAQKIDRIMETFAKHYCVQNPDVFSSSDCCYVLSFSIIMLNTTLHNRAVKSSFRQSVDQFITMNRDSNGGQPFPREMLVTIYESIKNEQFKIPEDDGTDLVPTFENPDRQGWLSQQGGKYNVTGWKRRWFVLNDNVLYYFTSQTDKEPKGLIPLENVKLEDIEVKEKNRHCFELLPLTNEVVKACKMGKDGKLVTGRHTNYIISADTAAEKEEWMRSIRSCTCENPYMGMLRERKKKAQRFYHSSVQ